MGAIGIKPTARPGSASWVWRRRFSRSANVAGGSVPRRQWTREFNTRWEFDYFHFTRLPATRRTFGPSAPGLAMTSLRVGLALRAEYLNDPDGYGIKGVGFPGRPGSAITSPDPDGDV